MQDLDAQCHLLMAVRTFQNKICIRGVLQARQHTFIAERHVGYVAETMIAVGAFQLWHKAATVILSLLSQ